MPCAFCGCDVKRLRANGKPFKFCTADCDKAAMTMRVLGLKVEDRNPPCSCGCGLEVARPWNQYLHGHEGNKKLDDEDVDVIRRLLEGGKSQYHIAALFGISQATISNIKLGSTHTGSAGQHGRSIVRLDEIKKRREMWAEVQWLRKSKKALRSVKGFLKQNS